MTEGFRVIGVGQTERGDDAVGPLVAESLRARGIDAVAHQGDGTGLLDLWAGVAVCVVVDAVAGGGAPGTLHVFVDPEDGVLARLGFVHSTHRIGLPEALALGRALGHLPDHLVVVGVSGTRFDVGGGLSEGVAAAAAELADTLARSGDTPEAIAACLLAEGQSGSPRATSVLKPAIAVRPQ